MKCLTYVLSALTIPYGVSFSVKLSLPVKLFVRFLLFLFFLDQVRITYCSFSGSLISVAGYVIYFIGSLIYTFVLTFRSELIVKTINNNLHLLSAKQYKFISIVFSFLLLEITLVSIIRFITLVVPSVIQLVKRETNNKLLYVGLINHHLVFHYYFWLDQSSLIYGLMYLMMHVRHMQLLSSAANIKSHSYVNWFKVVSTFKSDYETFDNSFSLLPMVWILAIFVDTAPNFSERTFYNLYVIIFFIQDYFMFPLILLSVHKLHSCMRKRVEQIILEIVLSGHLDTSSKDQLVNLVKQIPKFYVTAASLIRLDKSFILPFLGSLFTFSILFKENFSVHGKH